MGEALSGLPYEVKIMTSDHQDISQWNPELTVGFSVIKLKYQMQES